MYRLRFAKAAAKALAKAPQGIAARVNAELREIARAPASYRGDWKRLTGRPYWRLRVGDWRAICEFRDDELVLLVLQFGPRGDIYK
jgi:mRNA interferase RelE/StbE